MSSPSPTPGIHRISGSRALGLLLVLLLPIALLLPLAAFGRTPDPPQRIPLEPFGFQTISSRFLLQGATMLTIDYVDNQHLLVTFGISRLMPRLSDCPEEDEDRIVKAVLLELPSGRELAHTEWRFHDLGQYLWSLGDGHFMLRRRDSLTTFAPLQNLSSSTSFAEQPFLHFDRRIEAIIVSANHDLISIETVKHAPPKTAATTQTVAQTSSNPNQSNILSTGLQRRDPNASQAESKPDKTPVQIDFIRLLKKVAVPDDSSANARPKRFMGRIDGRIFTSTAVNVPVTTEGFLTTKATTRDGVLLDFLTFTGKHIDLGDFTTSCAPRPTFVSPSEFVAFGCRGSSESLDLAGFNLRGDFLWQINFDDEQAYPSFASVIPAGRFAFSRTVTSTYVFGSETPSMSQLQAQEVRVIQMYNGKQLLRVVTSPIQRAGQNFTLSPDGLSLAVIHDNASAKGDVVSHQTSVEIYKLPELSGKDLAQIKLEATMAPEPVNGDVHMRFSSEEIKAALTAKPEVIDSDPSTPPNPRETAPADSRIAGDPIPSPATTASTGSTAPPATGTIPSSDLAPACATLTDPSAAPAAGCPVTPSSKTAAKSPSPTDGDPDVLIEKRRKPPTLYEPAPPTPPQ